MSGIEIIGLVLGGFPLIISAMEHYKDVKKPTLIWWRIRRAHRRDYGKVKDCQFAFSDQLELLLYPLLDGDIVDQNEYEALLASPGSDGWQESRVEQALVDRLGERHARYVEILKEMNEVVMDKLCKSAKVDDPQFQKLLNDQEWIGAATRPTNVRPAQTVLRMKTNVNFQAKRLKYSLTELNRTELLEEVNDYIRRLRELLIASNELAALPRRHRRSTNRPVSRKVLDFWTHADAIFSLIRDTWHCQCRSSACLWLQSNYIKVTAMKLHLRFCHGGHSLLVKLSDSP